MNQLSAFTPQEQADAIVEIICNQGCAAAYRVLAVMERGEPLSELDGASQQVYSLVLVELRSIMAVYDARDGGAVCQLPSREHGGSG
jgi:hypothetical protein